MNKSLVNQVIEEFTLKSQIKRNFFELKHYKERATEQEIDDLNTFFRDLTDSGNFLDLVFLNNNLTVQDFTVLLARLHFPIIVFVNSDKILPAILFHVEDKYELTLFKDSKKQIEIFNSIDDVIKSICTIEYVTKNYAYNYEADNLDGDKDIVNDLYFITGFSVKPHLSEENEEGKSISPIKRLFRLLSHEHKDIGYIYFFALLIGIVNLSMPLGLQAIISIMSGGVIFKTVVVLIVLVVAATAMSGMFQIMQITFVEVLQQRVFTKAAYEFSFRIPKMRMESISKSYAPELINRFFDVINIQKSMPKFLIDLTSASLQIIFGVILLSFYHSMFILFGLLLIAIITVILWITGPAGLSSSINESKYKYKVAHWLEELGRNVTTFKLAGFTNLPIEKTDYYLSSYLWARQKHFKILRRQYVAIIIFKTIITAGLLIMGGFLVVDRQINLGQFIAAELIIVLVISSVEKLISTMEVIYDLLTALDKVGYVTDLPIEKSTGLILETIPGNEDFTIEIKNLRYKYEDHSFYTLDGINMSIKRGEKICLAGKNNSGKSTFMKILTGLHHNYEGVITFNKITLKDLSITSYRDMIGENISHDEIFEGTVEENITVGKRGITLQDLYWAVDKVGLLDFINTLPNGLQTTLTAGGKHLPTSICQKIILARSVAEKPKLLVMDSEFFAEQSDKKIMVDLLMNKENDWALVLVSNDPMLLSLADKVVYLNDGKMQRQGLYKDLMKDDDFMKLVLNNNK